MLNEGSGESVRSAISPTPDTVHHGKRTKVDRYKWTKLDAMGELKMLPKSTLEVDHAYQRQPSELKTKEIASDFSWVGFGAIVVADRGDGRFFVIDGQHRVLAALRRSDIDRVPCVVFAMESLSEEAQAFLVLNTNRKPLTGLAKHNAMVESGQPVASRVATLVASVNRTMVESSSCAGRVVGCVTGLQRNMAADADVTTKMFLLLDKVVGDRPIKEMLLEGLIWIEQKMPAGESLTDKRWRDRLVSVGYDDLNVEAKRAAAAFGKGGRAVWGRGMLRAINRGLRTKLVLPGVEEV